MGMCVCVVARYERVAHAVGCTEALKTLFRLSKQLTVCGMRIASGV